MALACEGDSALKKSLVPPLDIQLALSKAKQAIESERMTKTNKDLLLLQGSPKTT